ALSSPENRAFVQRFQARNGAKRVVTAPMAAAYAGVRLWASAVKEAGTTDAGVLLRTMDTQVYAAPEGQIRIEPSNNHTWKFFRMGKMGQAGALEIVSTSNDVLEPVPFPLSRTRAQWEALLDRLSSGWKGGWSNPRKPVLLR
ncbi:MAG: transporter substrate-binding protein, partial [Byssovorax sp.]